MPSPSYPPAGIYPFWFWNAPLDVAEIDRQIGEMAQQGVKGFYIHPRQGLGEPYLSDRFFACVQAAVESAERHGLVVHFYDEYPYPSGVAGGEAVLGQPQYQATSLVQRRYDVEGGHIRLQLPAGLVLQVVTVPLIEGQPDWASAEDVRSAVGMWLGDESYNETGLTAYNRKRYFASNPVPVLDATLPPGPHRIYASVQADVATHKYWDRFLDVLNPLAVRRFIELTHQRYADRFGDRFGSTIASIFVDETAPHWSSRIPDAFRNTYGYDLIPRLHILQDPAHPQHLDVARDLYRLRYRMFCEAFEEPLSTWCREHGIAYAGEKHALRLAQVRYMDIPGCDPGHTKAGAPKLDMFEGDARRNARATASAAYFYGKRGALCECYHSMGWSATLQDAKVVGEALLLNGIRYLVPHGFFYSTHALRKHDAPPTFFFQMPYWPFFGELSARLDRIADLFEGTWVDAEILIVEPESGMPTRDDHAAYTRIQESLLSGRFEYLMVDTDILESGRVEAGAVRIRDVTARVVILPPMRVVEPEMETWLATFSEAGGVVIRLEREFEPEDLLAELGRTVAPSLRITAVEPTERLHVVRRTRGGDRLWFLVNTGQETIHATITADEPFSELDLASDGAPPISGAAARIERTIEPFESLVLRPDDARPAPDSAAPPAPVHITVDGPARLQPLSPNLLRLYTWSLAVLDRAGDVLQTADVPAMPIANQLEKGNLRFAPTIRTFFGRRPELALPDLSLRYEVTFGCAFAGPVSLVMEPDSLVGAWRIRVNRADGLGPSDFRSSKAHVRGSLEVDITPYLMRGENTLTVEVETDRLDGGLRNPLYLAGDFAVSLSPLALQPPAVTGHFDTWASNGYPHYAGSFDFETQFMLDELPRGSHAEARFHYAAPFHDATEVSVNGGPWRSILWNPRRVVIPAEELRAGSNTLVTRVHTSLIRSFEGMWFDYDQHRQRDVSEGP